MPIENKAAGCPTDEALRGLAADPANGERGDVAAHVYACERCQRRLESIMYPVEGCSLTSDERNIIDSFVKSRCRSRSVVFERLDEFIAKRQAVFFAGDGSEDEWRLASATANGGAARAVEMEDVRFVFTSTECAAICDAWRAELYVPGEARGSDALSVTVKGRDGLSAGNGLFSIAGTTLVVEDGAATIPLDLFLVGIRNSRVAYQREGGAAVPGSLVFF